MFTNPLLVVNKLNIHIKSIQFSLLNIKFCHNNTAAESYKRLSSVSVVLNILNVTSTCGSMASTLKI